MMTFCSLFHDHKEKAFWCRPWDQFFSNDYCFDFYRIILFNTLNFLQEIWWYFSMAASCRYLLIKSWWSMSMGRMYGMGHAEWKWYKARDEPCLRIFDYSQGLGQFWLCPSTGLKSWHVEMVKWWENLPVSNPAGLKYVWAETYYSF